MEFGLNVAELLLMRMPHFLGRRSNGDASLRWTERIGIPVSHKIHGVYLIYLPSWMVDISEFSKVKIPQDPCMYKYIYILYTSSFNIYVYMIIICHTWILWARGYLLPCYLNVNQGLGRPQNHWKKSSEVLNPSIWATKNKAKTTKTLTFHSTTAWLFNRDPDPCNGLL